MFFKDFFKNKLNLTLMVLSLLSIIPLVVLIKNALDLLTISDMAHTNDKFITEVMSRTLTYTPNLIGFIIGIMVWIAAAGASAYALHTKKVRSVYGYMSLILGGIGIHIFVFLAYWLLNKKEAKEVKTTRTKAVIGVVTISAVSLVPIAALSIPYAKGTFDDAYIGNPIEISFNKDAPNLIEIFSDGLDRKYEDIATSDQAFKDFLIFDKFQTTGVNTHKTVPSINGQFTKENPFAVAQRQKFDPATSYADYVYMENHFNTSMYHMELDKNLFGQRTVVNTNTFWHGANSYGGVISGNPKQVKEADPSINVTNWSGARDSLFGKFGISNQSPDRDGYMWIEKNLVPADQTSKGARVYTSDLITHRPYLNTPDLHFTLTEADWNIAKHEAFDTFAELIQSLKDMKNPYAQPGDAIQTAYDNTMIIIYGDHASHDTEFDEGTPEANEIRKTESLLMVKYPSTAANDITDKNIKDRAVYSGQINGIISDYFNHVANYSPKTFFAQSKFDLDVQRPAFIVDNAFYYANWQNDKLQQVGNKHEYNPATLDQDVKELDKAGVYE